MGAVVKVIVTGARGFIGKALCKALREKGHDVVEVSVRAGDLPAIEGDVVFHLAHDHRPEQEQVLVDWYKKLEAHWRPVIRQQIYISSYSARSDALSAYGRSKYAIEQHFLAQGHAVVRPGLVIGHGGTFGSMLKLLQLSPIIPVPGGNSARVPYISLRHLCSCLTDFPQKESNLFAPQLAGLTDLLQAAAHQLGLKRFFAGFPACLALSGLTMAERCGLQLPVTSDNLRGLIGNQAQIHHATDAGETLTDSMGDL